MAKYINLEKQLVRLYRLNLKSEDVIKEFLTTADFIDISEEDLATLDWIDKHEKIFNNMLEDLGVTSLKRKKNKR